MLSLPVGNTSNLLIGEVKIEYNGAKFYVNASREIVAVDEVGNETVIS